MISKFPKQSATLFFAALIVVAILRFTPAMALGNFPITNTNDSGANSLRQAVTDANAYFLATSVLPYDVAVSGGTISLSSALPDANKNLIFNATSLTSPIAVTGFSVVNNNSFTFQGDQTFATDISSTGSVTIDSGTVTLSGNNTYSGGTTIAGGILSVASQSNYGSGNVTINNGASLMFTDGATVTNDFVLNGAAGIIANSANPTLQGVISGAGNLHVSGGGNLFLENTNTYSGGTTLNNGGVVITSDDNLGSGDISMNNGLITMHDDWTSAKNILLNDNGGLIIGSGHALNLSGQITGTGLLELNNVSTATLADNNTYSGGTDIVSTAVTLSSSSSLGTGLIRTASAQLNFLSDLTITNDITNNNLLGINTGGHDITFSGNITGGYGNIQNIQILGGGKVTLTGTNTYSKGIQITEGTLSVSHAQNLGPIVSSLSEAPPVQQAEGGGGIDTELGVIMDGGTLEVTGDMEYGGPFQLNSNASKVVVSDDKTFTLSGKETFYSAGTLHVGDETHNGKLVLNSGSSSIYYDGAVIDVDYGQLQIGDENHPDSFVSSAITVNAPAILSGHGTINGDVTNHGDVIPGGSIGTLTINGNYNQASNGKLLINITPAGSSKLVVNGQANLDGSLLINFAQGLYLPATYTVLTANRIVGSAFALVGPPGMSADGHEMEVLIPDYTDKTAITVALVDVTVERSRTATNYNASTSQSINSGHNASGAIFDHLGDAPDETDSGNDVAFTSINRSDVTHEENKLGLNDLAKNLPKAMKEHGGWFKATGSLASLNSNATSSGYRSEAGGFMFGVDKAIEKSLKFGVAGGYEHTGITGFSANKSNAEDNAVRLSIYGSKAFEGKTSLDMQAGYALHMVDGERYDTISKATARSSHVADELSFAAQAVKKVDVEGFILAPRAGFSFIHLIEDGFVEKDAGFSNMTVDSKVADSLRFYTGAGISKAMNINALSITPEAHIKYSYEVIDPRVATSGTVGLSTVTVNGVQPSRHILSLGTGFSERLDDTLDAFGNYDVNLPTGNSVEQMFALGLRYRF